MIYAEICAGVGGGSLGLHRAGFRAAWLNEINRRAADVLRARFPDTPVYEADASTLNGRALLRDHGRIDLLVGGTPCQDLSIAGRRTGLHGDKSIIFYQLVRLWEETQAPYVLWENVPGALSSHGGRDFAQVLSAFVGAAITLPRTRWRRAGVAAGPDAVAAWRVLDAQYFGVPQRRARVFVFAARTGGIDPAQVLFECDGVCGHSAASSTTGETSPRSSRKCAPKTCNYAIDNTLAFNLSGITRPGERSRLASGRPSPTLTVDGMIHIVPAVAPTLTAHYAKGGNPTSDLFIVGRHEALAFNACRAETWSDDRTPMLVALGHRDGNRGGNGSTGLLRLLPAGCPRRLLPVECERLMGWPDGWTDVPDRREKPASDTFRYRACGNGIVSHMTQWIGERILRHN